MIRLYARKSDDLSYYRDDPARELDGVRDGPPAWWIRGVAPQGDEAWRVLQGSTRSEIVGYDLVVSATRQVSTLLAVGSPREQRELVSAHRRAVLEVVSYLEERALIYRDRRQGEDIEIPTAWDRVVSFTHGINRALEPHLHDHVIVGARATGVDRAIDSRALYAHLETADALYRAQLRHDINQMGRAAERQFDGRDHIEGVTASMLALWPGGAGRGRDKSHPTRTEIRDRWERFLETRVEVDASARWEPERAGINEHYFGSLVEPFRLVARRDIVRAYAHASRRGALATDISALTDELWPALRDERGFREQRVSLAEARQIGEVRIRGPRPTRLADLAQWRQRDLARDSRAR